MLSIPMFLRLILWGFVFYGIGRYLFATDSVACLFAGMFFGMLYETYNLLLTLIAVIMRAADFFSKGLGIKGDEDNE